MDIETLNAIAVRLRDHSESITNIARQDMADDLLLAAKITDDLASLRFRVAGIAETCLQQDPGATRRDLLHALDRTAKE